MGLVKQGAEAIDWLKVPVGRKRRSGPDRRTGAPDEREDKEDRRVRPRDRRLEAETSPPPEKEAGPTEIGDVLVGGLRAVGATIISGLGLGGSILLIGSAVLWERFHQAGLPATQSLQRVPESQITIEGVSALALPVLLALVAVLFVYALDPGGMVTRGSIGATIILALGACGWAIAEHASDELGFWAAVVLCFVALLLLLASTGVARSSGNRFLPFAAAIFISAAVFTAGLTVASEAHRGKIQPAAVLKSPDGLGLFGFYVADTEDAIYLGLVRDGHEPSSGDPVALYTIPREPETRLLIGPAASWEEALANACELRSQLKPGWASNPACGNLRAALAQYLALGDSYSSGEGAPPYDLGERCHRSSSGWPSITAANAEDIVAGESVNLACSGATIRDLDESFKGDPSQLDRINANNDLITITIGGNDAGFSRVLIRCRPTGFECSESAPVRAAAEKIRRELPSELQVSQFEPGAPIAWWPSAIRGSSPRAPTPATGSAIVNARRSTGSEPSSSR